MYNYMYNYMYVCIIIMLHHISMVIYRQISVNLLLLPQMDLVISL